MSKKIVLLSALFVSLMTFAQVPQGISYQAIALNGSGTSVVSSNVRVRLSVLDVSATGTVLYSETQLKMTNAQGLFNLTIGQGTVVSGVFASINWGMNSKFLKVEMDATGGTTFAAVGTTQLLSVPYAMHAGTVASIAGNSSINDDIIGNKTSNFAFVDEYDHKVYAYNTATGTWTSQTFNINASPTVETSNGNFAFIDEYDHKAYTYNGKTGLWSSQTFNVNATPSFDISNGNLAFVDEYDHKVYIYNGKTGTWAVQTFNINATPTLEQSNGNFAFVDEYAHKTYAFSGIAGTWSSQTFNINATPTLLVSNGNFAFIDEYDHKAYTYNGKTSVWSSQTFNVNASPTFITSETN